MRIVYPEIHGGKSQKSPHPGLAGLSSPFHIIRDIRSGLFPLALQTPRPYMPAGSGVRHLVIQ